MNIKILHESDMELCYDIDSTFLCEEYINSLKINNLKSVEFITIYNGKILFIEAKKTAPFPKNIEIENSDYKKYINDICQKAKDSFAIFASIIMNLREENICIKLRNADYKNIEFKLVVIIKNHDKKWCGQIKNALENNLRHFAKVWNWGTYPVMVLNEQMACNKGLVVSREQTEQ